MAKRIRLLRLKWWNRWYAFFIIIIAIALLFEPIWTSTVMANARFRMYQFQSQSTQMWPTLYPKDRFVVDNWAYRNRSPQRGDIVVFRSPLDEKALLIRRCVALPNDSIQIRKHRILINNQPVKELQATEVMLDDFGPYRVPVSRYFCLSDNTNQGPDSRHFGAILISDIEAKVLYIYWSNEARKIGLTLE